MQTDQIEKLERDLSLASTAVKKCITGKPGDSAEKKYGMAYQELVKVGLRPKIRKKYRQ